MRLPFDRLRLASRNELDIAEQREAEAQRSPEARLLSTLELSELVRELADATGAAALTAADLEEKAARYARPLRFLLGQS